MTRVDKILKGFRSTIKKLRKAADKGFLRSDQLEEEGQLLLTDARFEELEAERANRVANKIEQLIDGLDA